MKVNILKLTDTSIPETLREIPHPPRQLFWAGSEPEAFLQRPRVAIVGSRKASPYGRRITEELARKLAVSGVVIISGLAFGVDSYAHSSAVSAGGLSIAVLPSPLEQIYPASHRSLALQILENGGALVSEYPKGAEVYSSNFIARNRLISALADVLVITEAAKNSGSLHTARFALEQGKTVMAVPGNINSPTSEGCNNLIKSGAMPVTGPSDVFFALGIEPTKEEAVRVFKGTAGQQKLIDLIAGGLHTQEELALASQLSGPQFSATLTELELQGYIRPLGAGNWTIS